jgi:hypothetical protein
MSNEAKLRALLAEARGYVADCFTECASAETLWMLQRIDAALAEPVVDYQRERDEAWAIVGNAEKMHTAIIKAIPSEHCRDAPLADVVNGYIETLKNALAMAEQVSGVLCDDCGWAMKFPNEPCRCQIVKQLDEARAELASWRGNFDGPLAFVRDHTDKAYQRGAEAMREKAANAIPGHYSGDIIRALPLPEEAP